jgi:dihydroxyacetone kinase-like protein
MSETIGYAQICAMLNAATAQIRTHHETLSRLDAATGDGDHGTTILRTMEAVSKTVAGHTDPGLRPLLCVVAWSVMSCDGGCTGPLLGSFFLGMSEGCGERDELDLAGLVAAFESGVTKLQKQSRAGIGDKTMMDAFLPAIAAVKAAPPDSSIKAALEQAAQAAAQGAEATKNMRAKFGRARNLGDRVLGHPDPGAVSVSLLFKGFSEGV